MSKMKRLRMRFERKVVMTEMAGDNHIFIMLKQLDNPNIENSIIGLIGLASVVSKSLD